MNLILEGALAAGIVTTEMTTQRLNLTASLRRRARICEICGSEGHDDDVRFCKDFGASMPAGGQQ
ncbi:hypothetical protein ACFQUU_11300 [Herbaspirillum sp. GCM10030257]|uniref:hypothetical protein n=1 Tax=Herbaspirillum sp. GCM10030257 TaxID=3273393 RepID=UPI003610DDC9